MSTEIKIIEKEAYEIFKFFKDTYTKINCAEEVLIFSSLDILLSGCKNEDFFILTGKILVENTLFRFLKANKYSLRINVNDLGKIAKCLKKEINYIMISDNTVHFVFADNDIEINLLSDDNLNSDRIIKLNSIKKVLPANKTLLTNIDSEVITFFENNDLEKKVIEIPRSRVLSIQKNCDVYIRYSTSTLPHYVGISSATPLLELEQIFATI